MFLTSLLRGLVPKHPSRVRSKPRSKNVVFYFGFLHTGFDRFSLPVLTGQFG
jgi:hypothetical protein